MYLHKVVPQRACGSVVLGQFLSQLAGNPLHLILLKEARHLTTYHQLMQVMEECTLHKTHIIIDDKIVVQ